MMKTSLIIAVFALTATMASAQVISLEDAQLPTNLSDADVVSLAQGFCADGNTTGLTTITLGVAQSRIALLDNIFQDIAQNCPASADTLVYTIQQNLPEMGLASFAAMGNYLQQHNQSNALALLNSSNANLVAQLSGQGLNIETAAGPAEMDFDALLKSLNIPLENATQPSGN